MSGPNFRTKLVLEEHMRGARSVPGEWVLHFPLIYDSFRGPITVPRGFVTDLASIPQIVRNLLDVNDAHRRAAVLHDYGYVMQFLTRKETDDMFLEAMEVCGVPAWKRYLMYSAVRTGGWIYWNIRSKTLVQQGSDFVSSDYFDEHP